MREAAADLDFEEAARLRDEIKRLRQTELAVLDDPTARDVAMAQDPKLRRAVAKGRSPSSLEGPHKPHLDEMGIATWHEVKPARAAFTAPLAGEAGANAPVRATRGGRITQIDARK